VFRKVKKGDHNILRIWEQTAAFAVYVINCLVFITVVECLQRGTDWLLIYSGLRYVFRKVKKGNRNILQIWEQTAAFAVYVINWFVLIAMVESV
jgi:hypothetical protein